MEWAQSPEIILRSVMALVTLFFLTKLLGKKQISQLSVFEYIIGISVGSIAAEMSVNIDTSYIHGIISMTVYVLIVYGMSFLTIKSMTMRRIFTGTPSIIVEKGKILEKELKRCLLDVNDLLEECRNKGYFDLSQLEYVIMETSGKVSFLPKSDERPLKPKDLNLKPSYDALLANVVIDEKVMQKNLATIKKDDKWLMKRLKKQGYRTLDNILLVTVDATETITVYRKNRSIEPNKYLE